MDCNHDSFQKGCKHISHLHFPAKNPRLTPPVWGKFGGSSPTSPLSNAIDLGNHTPRPCRVEFLNPQHMPLTNGSLSTS